MDELTRLKQKYGMLCPYLNEASMRACVAADAITLGRGGPSLVARASGLISIRGQANGIKLNIGCSVT
jgi:hypothetical protein